METLLFVYGSLMLSLAHNNALENEIFVGRYQTKDLFDMIDLGAYPMVIVNKLTQIWGELHVVSPEVLELIDRMEVSAGYERKLVELVGFDKVVNMYIGKLEYCWGEDRSVPDGDWDAWARSGGGQDQMDNGLMEITKQHNKTGDMPQCKCGINAKLVKLKNYEVDYRLGIEVPDNVNLYYCTVCRKLHVEYDQTSVEPEGVYL